MTVPAKPPARIFVSHSHADNDFGKRLVQDLRRALGSEDAVWYDSAGGLHGGDAWWRTIVSELSARSVFIVILSPDSVSSKWVNDEIDLAWQAKNADAGKVIIPVICRACDVRADLKTRQVVTFAPPTSYAAAFDQLLSALALAPSDVTRVPPSGANRAGARGPSKVPRGAWAGLAAVLIVALLSALIIGLGKISGGNTGTKSPTFTTAPAITIAASPVANAQSCVNTTWPGTWSVALDNTANAVPVQWSVNVTAKDPKGNVWASVDPSSGTLDAHEGISFVVSPNGQLCADIFNTTGNLQYAFDVNYGVAGGATQHLTITHTITPDQAP